MDHAKELARQMIEAQIEQTCAHLDALLDCPEKEMVAKLLEEMQEIADSTL